MAIYMATRWKFRFIKMLRQEQKFVRLDELKAQIALDVELARQMKVRFA